jgi:integrase
LKGAGGLRANTLRSKTRALLKYAAPLHSTPIDAVDQRAVARLLTQVELSSGAVTANRLRANMSAMYTWALKEGIATGNPVANTYKREERPRDRVLSNKELALIWQALPDGNYGDIVKLLILTGQRANEIARLKWSEIEAGQIALPRERTKNDRAHTVPLAPTALAILKLQTPRPDTDFVFGRRRDAAFADWFHAKRTLDARLAELNSAPLPQWVDRHGRHRNSAARHRANFKSSIRLEKRSRGHLQPLLVRGGESAGDRTLGCACLGAP